MTLDIRPSTLAQMLAYRQPFEMARYQRHYEWGRREMEQLLGDFGDVFPGAGVDPERARKAYHFLGNVIAYDGQAGHLEIVDGQQRLTSLVLFLSAALDLPSAASMRDELHRLLFIDDASGRAIVPRLKLHRGDQEFLEAIVRGGASETTLRAMGRQSQPSAECLRTNWLIARTYLKSIPSARMIAFLRFVLDGSRFVELRVDDEDDAFRIFETVNSRGRPIANEDILRFALMNYATDDIALRDAYLARWDEMESELGPRGMKRFINSWKARLTKGGKSRKSLHGIVLGSFETPLEARTFLDTEFSSDVSIFRQIGDADIALDDGPVKKRIDTLLRSFTLVDFDEWFALVNVLVRQGLEHPERLADDLARVERLVWFYYMNGDDKGIAEDRRNHFLALMKAVSPAGSLDHLPKASILSEEQRTKMRSLVEDRIDAKWVPLRSLLVRLEMALSGDGSAPQRESVTIEHILPLRPTAKGWLSLFDDNIKTVTEHAERIGNLCLVPPHLNTQLGNRVYAAKRKLIMADGLHQRSHLAADIAKVTVWDRDVIARRSRWLLGVFCDMFDVHAPTR